MASLFLGFLAPTGWLGSISRVGTVVSYFILATRLMPAFAILIPTYLIFSTLGLQNTRVRLVVAYTSFSLPFAIWVMRGFIRRIPVEIEESAKIDGCSTFRSSFDSCAAFASRILRGGYSASPSVLGEFIWALVLTSDKTARTLPVLISGFQAAMGLEWGTHDCCGEHSPASRCDPGTARSEVPDLGITAGGLKCQPLSGEEALFFVRADIGKQSPGQTAQRRILAGFAGTYAYTAMCDYRFSVSLQHIPEPVCFTTWRDRDWHEVRWFSELHQGSVDSDFLQSLMVTAVFVVAVMAAEFVLGLALALLLNRKVIGERLLRTSILIPLMTAPVVVGLGWKIMLNPDFGFVSHFLSWLGFGRVSLLGDPKFALWAIIAVDVWQFTPSYTS